MGAVVGQPAGMEQTDSRPHDTESEPAENPTVAPYPSAPELQPQMTDEVRANFPAGPPAPLPSSAPPPLAPSGRWLHTSVLINGKMMVFGGVGSYSTALYNDLWVFNVAEQTWSQLQASFVPPFPLPAKNKGGAKIPNDPMDQFRPADSPPAPALNPAPDTSTELRTVEQGGQSRSIQNPIASPKSGTKIPVNDYTAPPDRSAYKAPGFSFLETDVSVQEKVSHEERKVVADRHAHLLKVGGMFKSKEELQAAKERKEEEDISFLEMNAKGKANMRSREKGQPPLFWKSDNLAPNMQSPFISADLWMYNLDTKEWHNIKSVSVNVPAPRWLHTAVHCMGRMIIFGGVSYSDIILGDLWVFDINEFTWTKAVPTGPVILPREGHSATVTGNGQEMMWVFGGISYGHIPFNDLWSYNTRTNQWALEKPNGVPPPPRWLHTASEFQDSKGNWKIFVFGGVTRNWVPLDDLYVFDVATRTWVHPKTQNYPPFPRMLHAASIINIVQPTLMVCGGTANNIPFDDCWNYDIVEQSWNEIHEWGAFPFAREGHSMVRVDPLPRTTKATPREPWDPEKYKDYPPVDPLMPTIFNVTKPRPLNRYRKEVFENRWVIVFGGAGPKPRLEDQTSNGKVING